ncbi:zinc finger, CCHC-type containing protein, partial [Tanacetum coccineum]
MRQEPTLQVALDALKLTPFYNAFGISANVPEIYMQEFWVTVSRHHSSLCFKLNGKSHTVNVDNFRDMLKIFPKLPSQKFDEPPLEEEILSFIRDLGHTGEIKFLSDVNVNHMHQQWRSFAAIINKCLSGKTTALESLRLSRAQILWGMYHNKKVDYVYLLWEDLVFQVANKNSKKNNDMYYPRFTKVIVDYFMAKDQAIPRRNKMFRHYARDDFIEQHKAIAKKKQLVLVVEGTTALAPHWPTILEDYLSKLIRSNSHEAATPYVELALVVFNAPGSYSRAYISSPDFSYPDMSQYLLFSSVLSMNFSDGGFCEAAIAEGLAEGLKEVLMMAYPVQNINHSAFRSMFEREKLFGNNFNYWFRQLKLVLRVEKKMYVIEQPIPPAPAADSAANVLLHRKFENSSPYEMLQELKSMFEKQAGVERFDLIQTFHACKQEEGKLVGQYVLKMKGYVEQLECLGYVLPRDLSVGLILNGLTSDFAGFVRNCNMHNMGKTIGDYMLCIIEYEKVKGKGRQRKSYVPKPKNPKPNAKEHPTKNDACHHCKEVGHWKRNCSVYLVELMKNKKQVGFAEIFKTATRIISMVPTKKVDKTPYELWYGKDTHNKRWVLILQSENKIVVARYAEFLEKNLLSQEISGRAEELKEIQDEDTSPSKNTSEIPMKVEGLKPPQEEVVPIRRFARTHRAPDRLCINAEVKEHSLGDLNEPANYKAAILYPKSD